MTPLEQDLSKIVADFNLDKELIRIVTQMAYRTGYDDAIQAMRETLITK